LIAGGIAALCLVLVVLSRSRFSRAGLALLLVTAGAVGNYLDRILRGYVVDFMHVEHWPVFNVADIYVTLGVGLFAISMLAEPRVRSRA
jgi:signal peptidase II